MAETAEQYLTRIMTESGKSADEISLVIKTLSDPKVASHLNETVKRATDDFQSMTGRVGAAEKKIRDYHAWYEDAKRQVDAVLATKSGSNHEEETTTTTTTVNGKQLTMDQVKALLDERDSRIATVMVDGLRLSSHHAAKYGEALDTNALQSLAAEKGLSLTAAYELMVKPRVEAEDKKKFDEAIEKAKREAVAEYLTKVSANPGNPSGVATSPSPIYASSQAGKGATDAELMEAWMLASASDKK